MWRRLIRSRRHGGGLGELGAGVDAGLERLRREVHRDALAVSDEQPDRVGQVELALGVVRLDPVERRPELLGAEDVDRGVGLAQRELLRASRRAPRRSARGSVGSPHEPAVGAGVVVLDRRAPSLRRPPRGAPATRSRSISAVRSTASPERTSTFSVLPSSAARDARTASPVPSGCSCTATS